MKKLSTHDATVVIATLSVLTIIFNLGSFITRSEMEAGYTTATAVFEPAASYEPEMIPIPEGVEKFVVGFGRTQSVGNFSISLNDILEDSRCPIDVQCIQAGQLTVSAGFSETDEATGEVTEGVFDIILGDEVTLWNGYQIALVSALPDPVATITRVKGDYEMTFLVLKMPKATTAEPTAEEATAE